MIIQFLVIFFAVYASLSVLSRRRTHRGKATKKLSLIALTGGMGVGVLFPDSITWVANKVGVGRGTDLLVYILSVAFVVFVVNDYLSRQDEKDNFIRLSREIALMNAKKRYNLADK